MIDKNICSALHAVWEHATDLSRVVILQKDRVGQHVRCIERVHCHKGRILIQVQQQGSVCTLNTCIDAVSRAFRAASKCCS